MRRLSVFLFAVLAGLWAVVAAPAEHEAHGTSFSLLAAKRQSHKRDFLNDWAAAHRKWGSGVSKDAVDMLSLVEGETRVDVLPMAHDEVYVAEVEIGSPPQKVKMALDTGSSDSTDTRYRINRHGPWPPRYSPNASTTARKMENAMWNIQYADDSNAVGIVYRDTLRMGDLEVQDALIESAAIVSDSFERETGFSGIMGLAKQLQNNIEPPQPSFLSLLQHRLKAPVFTVDLRKNASSRFDFGRVDETLASDGLTWLDSDAENPHWSVRLDLTAWTGNDSVWVYHKFDAIIDTGTSLVFLPDTLAATYWQQVPGARALPQAYGSYSPCDAADDLPDLLIKLPGTEHVLRVPGRYLDYGPTRHDPTLCWGGMQGSAQFDGTAILGDVMLKALFVAFDVDKGRIGFANKVLRDVE